MQPEKGQFSCFKLKNSISVLLTLSVTGVSIEGAEEPEQGRGQDWEHWISGGMGDSSSNIFLPHGRQVPYCKKAGLYFFNFCPCPHLSCSALARPHCWCQPLFHGSCWKPGGRRAGKQAESATWELQRQSESPALTSSEAMLVQHCTGTIWIRSPIGEQLQRESASPVRSWHQRSFL